MAGNILNGDGQDITGEIVSNGYNFIGNATGTTPAPTDKTFANTGTTLIQLLETHDGIPAFANNGGPTLTINLVSGSPAIHGGNVADAPDSPWDQRGPEFVRIINNQIDIGAIEFDKTATRRPIPRKTRFRKA